MPRRTEDGEPLGPCSHEGCRYNGWRKDDDDNWWCRRHDPMLSAGRDAVRNRRRAASGRGTPSVNAPGSSTFQSRRAARRRPPA